MTLLMTGFPIRKSADHRFCAAPRGVSPLYASFFGNLSLGIHRAPFVAYLSSVYSVLFTHISVYFYATFKMLCPQAGANLTQG